MDRGTQGLELEEVKLSRCSELGINPLHCQHSIDFAYIFIFEATGYQS